MPTYIARISYGKDSLKMLDVIASRHLPLDRITTSDVWATDTIPAELPPVVEFKARMDEYIFKKYRIEVEHLCARNKDGSKRTYEQMFYHVPDRSQNSKVEREREREGRVAKIQGFPPHNIPWCQSRLKQRTVDIDARSDKGIPRNGKESHMVSEAQGTSNFSPETAPTVNKDIVSYIGIAADEPKRFGQLNHKLRAPLVEFGIDEDLCGLHCMYEGILSPTYDNSYRDGCWFCHNQPVDQLRRLRALYPDRWALLLKWDKDSPTTFHPDGHTVADFDKRFQLEDEKLIDPLKPFRWSMIEDGAILQTHLF